MIKHDLSQGPTAGHLYRMSVPMVWGILAIMSMNIVDTYYVAQLGTDELAAMGFTLPFVSVLLSLAFGVGIGSSSVIARALGAKQFERVQSYATQSVIIALAVALSFALLGYHFMDELLGMLGAPTELFPLLHDFLDIWFLGSFLVVIPMVGNSALRAAGNTQVPSLVMIAVALVNIVLDPILIFGLFGAPRMELAGAALATLISYAIALAIGLYYQIYKLQFISLRACYHKVVNSWVAILRIAIPATGTNLIAPLSIAVTTWLVAQHSAAAVAGFGIAARVESICLVLVMALSSIMGPFVGQNYGAERLDRVYQALKQAFIFVSAWGAVMALILALFAKHIISGFTDDVLVAQSAQLYLWLVPISFACLGMIMVTSSTANGMGQPKPSLFMSFMRMLGLYLPLALTLNHYFDLAGIYLATSLANILVGMWAFNWSRQLKPAIR